MDASSEDFTRAEYRRLLRLVKTKWPFQVYGELDRGSRFVLWRHDVDFSLHSALALARIEAEEGVRSTFFLHLHSQFYNLLEPGMRTLAREIISLGHHIGLHFDSHYHGVSSENGLDEPILWEASILERMIASDIRVFSFHNTTPFTMSCQDETYGGLINTYAAYFQREVAYVSDSNGYWRNRTLRDVVENDSADRLQVLTHPGWWQEQWMPPRDRVWRCVSGRAARTIQGYDDALAEFGRSNVYGPSSVLLFLRVRHRDLYHFLDELWSQRRLETLFLELYRLQEGQLMRLCNAFFLRDWGVAPNLVGAFFQELPIAVDGWAVIERAYGSSRSEISKSTADELEEWAEIRRLLVRGRTHLPATKLEQGCSYLCEIIANVSQWALARGSLEYDGLPSIEDFSVERGNFPTTRASDDRHGTGCIDARWAEFTATFQAGRPRSGRDSF